ncbi:MAG: WD40/YVTN/BNR-like repeat-containing protein, partial [Planctomycetota bacterium]
MISRSTRPRIACPALAAALALAVPACAQTDDVPSPDLPTAAIGTEETADIYKTEDAGRTWRKTVDGLDAWDINDVRYFIRAHDGRLYATTTEPALVIRSEDEGETWDVVARAEASRTVALTQLDDGTILVGLRRSENDRISILRSTDGFETFDWIALDDELPRQN